MRILFAPFLVALAMFSIMPTGASAQSADQDADGIPDSADAFPCDATRAGAAYAPAQGAFAMLEIEDHWPDRVDLDFNDVVLAHNVEVITNAAGRATSLRMTIVPLALGGTFSNGLALHLPVARSSASSITRTVGAGAPESLTTLASEAELTVELSGNLRELFAGRTGQINSMPGAAQTGATLELSITFGTPVDLSTSNAPWDLFIFRTGQRSLEIHRPMYSGTSLMNAALFNTGIDGSTSGRSFVTTEGVPFALDLPELGSYPAEGVDISALFPRIAAFAASGGVSARDFYRVEVNAGAAFSGALTPSFPAGDSSAADTSCLPSAAPPWPVYSGGAGNCPTFISGRNSMMVGGVLREFEMRLPASSPVGRPLLLAFHWAGGLAEQAMTWTGVQDAAYLGGWIAVAGEGNISPFGWRHGQGPDGNEDLLFFTDMLACLDENFSVDRNQVYLWGFSSGGLMVTYLTMHRGQYISAAVSFSGGHYGGPAGGSTTYWTYHQPGYRVPSLLVWGGPQDYYPPTNLSFHVANQIFSQELRNDGHFVTECEGTFGHNMPNEMYGWPNFWIQFLSDHPRGTVGSPYLNGGLPSIFPNYCRIPQ